MAESKEVPTRLIYDFAALDEILQMGTDPNRQPHAVSQDGKMQVPEFVAGKTPIVEFVSPTPPAEVVSKNPIHGLLESLFGNSMKGKMGRPSPFGEFDAESFVSAAMSRGAQNGGVEKLLGGLAGLFKGKGK